MNQTTSSDDTVQVAKQFPVELLVELIEGRLHRRRQAFRRWVIGTFVAFLSLGVGTVALLNQELAEAEERRDRRDARARLGGLAATERFASSEEAKIGTTDAILARSQRRPYKIQVDESGSYRLGVVSAANELDPEVFLYRQLSADVVELVAYNDDFEDTLDSQIDTFLEAGKTYYVEVGEFHGSPGAMSLTLEFDG